MGGKTRRRSGDWMFNMAFELYSVGDVPSNSRCPSLWFGLFGMVIDGYRMQCFPHLR